MKFLALNDLSHFAQRTVALAICHTREFDKMEAVLSGFAVVGGKVVRAASSMVDGAQNVPRNCRSAKRAMRALLRRDNLPPINDASAELHGGVSFDGVSQSVDDALKELSGEVCGEDFLGCAYSCDASMCCKCARSELKKEGKHGECVVSRKEGPARSLSEDFHSVEDCIVKTVNYLGSDQGVEQLSRCARQSIATSTTVVLDHFEHQIEKKKTVHDSEFPNMDVEDSADTYHGLPSTKELCVRELLGDRTLVLDPVACAATGKIKVVSAETGDDGWIIV